jgi:iron complex outermembrane receptor protein
MDVRDSALTRTTLRSILFLSYFLILAGAFAAGLGAAENGAVIVNVRQANDTPAVGTRVSLVELHRSEFTGDDGAARFDNVPAGRYRVQAVSTRFGTALGEVVVEDAPETSVTLTLGRSEHQERIVVTSTRHGRGTSDVFTPVQILDDAVLSEKLQPTIGETLAQEPGVTSTYFGPGSSRPVIRGQGGGRIRVLEGGLDTGDASTTSPDHAVSTDAMNAERIEVLRGPATLLYGSTAVGGVVNVIDGRVPEYKPNAPIGGSVQLRYASAAEEEAVGVNLDGGFGQFAWHVDALDREAEDVDIPGRAVEDDPDSPKGTLRNSSLESEGATVGVSWVGENGFVGVSARSFDTNYGIPAELEEDHGGGMGMAGEEEEEGVRIDLEQRRFDLRGGFQTDLGPFHGVHFGLATTDYEHKELEGGEVGTLFENETDEARFEMHHEGRRNLHGVIGAQYTTRDFEATGAEAFLPASETEALALFVLEEIEKGALRFELGARFESTDVETPASVAAEPDCVDPRNRSFEALSGSFGLLWSASEGYTVGSSLSRTTRPPSAEELYSCGEHVATASVEIGDPNLDEESTLGLDVSVRKVKGRVTGQVNLFRYDYDDYIYERDTGLTEPPMDPDGLPVFQFTQADAEFTGAEALAVIELIDADAGDFHLELSADYVEAELDDGENLPRIPPLRTGAALHFKGPRWHASAEVTRYHEQDQNAPIETETDGYTMVGASVGYRILTRGVVHDLLLRGSNLTDEEARNHASRLKDLVPLPGRDISFVYKLIF